jgi:beta-phosphoglucomutase-like phosphatase (HAD superfamily)
LSFDCDGTLVDSQQTIITATEAALGSHDFHGTRTRRDILIRRRPAGRRRACAAMRTASHLTTRLLNMLDVYRETYQQLVQQR